MMTNMFPERVPEWPCVHSQTP